MGQQSGHPGPRVSFLRRRPRRNGGNRNTGRVDLYLGFGAWSLLGDLPVDEVRRVIGVSAAETQRAKALGIECLTGNANKLEFSPAPVALSLHYPYRIKPELLAQYQNCYNLHPGFLPWCRGLSSVNWALWDSAPAGATLHEMVAELDAGPIVDQIKVEYEPNELYGEVQRRVDEAERELLQRYWKKIVSGETLPASPQSGDGSSHTQKELSGRLRKLQDEKSWSGMDAAELIRMARCFGQLELDYKGRRLRVLVTATPKRSP